MHIAICDDNVADRKQLERLLGRESDARKSETGVFYTDSFGVGSQLFPKRKSYDLFFIDIVEDTENGLEFALNLCADGVTAPIVLCSSKLDYSSLVKELKAYPDNILFLNKPIIKKELSELLDKAVVISENQVPTIELRHQNETYYVLEDDIVYAETDKQFVNVYLKDGTCVPILTDIYNFFELICMYTHFALISTKTIVNAVYVEKYSPFKVSLKSGLSFPATFVGVKDLKTALKYIEDENS